MAFAVPILTVFLCAFLYFSPFQPLQYIPWLPCSYGSRCDFSSANHTYYWDLDLKFELVWCRSCQKWLIWFCDHQLQWGFPDSRSYFLTISEEVAVVIAWHGENLSLESFALPL